MLFFVVTLCDNKRSSTQWVSCKPWEYFIKFCLPSSHKSHRTTKIALDFFFFFYKILNRSKMKAIKFLEHVSSLMFFAEVLFCECGVLFANNVCISRQLCSGCLLYFFVHLNTQPGTYAEKECWNIHDFYSLSYIKSTF